MHVTFEFPYDVPEHEIRGGDHFVVTLEDDEWELGQVRQHPLEAIQLIRQHARDLIPVSASPPNLVTALSHVLGPVEPSGEPGRSREAPPLKVVR